MAESVLLNQCGLIPHRGFESLSPPLFSSSSFNQNAPVAQLDRVPGYELGGREFESLRARHLSFPHQVLS